MVEIVCAGCCRSLVGTYIQKHRMAELESGFQLLDFLEDQERGFTTSLCLPSQVKRDKSMIDPDQLRVGWRPSLLGARTLRMGLLALLRTEQEATNGTKGIATRTEAIACHLIGGHALRRKPRPTAFAAPPGPPRDLATGPQAAG